MVNPTSFRAWSTSAATWCAPSSLPTTATAATLPYVNSRPRWSFSDSSASSRSSTILHTLDGCPIQIGVARIRTSAASSLVRIAGQPSSGPSSTETPNLTPWSTTRTNSPSTSCSDNAARTCTPSSSELDAAGDAFNEQPSTSARNLPIVSFSLVLERCRPSLARLYPLGGGAKPIRRPSTVPNSCGAEYVVRDKPLIPTV